MKLAVSERFTINSNLSVDDALQRLASVVEPPKRKWFGMPSTWKRKPYQGTISGNSFQIERVIDYRNSFLPIIHGALYERSDGGTNIEINMNINTFAFAFMSFWLLSVGSFGICALGAAMSTATFVWLDLMPVVMFAFGVAMTVGGFSVEANKSKGFLYKLFAQDTSPQQRHSLQR